MLKASALYIVIVIALVIALLCSSLIVAGYFYRLQYQKASRSEYLQTNLSSGISILIAEQDSSSSKETVFSLFGGETDSVALKKMPWGVYDIGVVKAFVQKDTLYKAFTIANVVDSAKWAVLYLADEDRPVSVSGKSVIKGDAYLPKAGAKEAYVNNAAYQGDKKIVTGKIHTSAKKIPDLNQSRLTQIEDLFSPKLKTDSGLSAYDSLKNSFLLATRIVSFGKKVATLEHIKIDGHVILHSDTTLIIDSSAHLNNVVVAAKCILVDEGFHGTCQLFATDSISIAKNCNLFYPSCVGLTRLKSYSFSIPAHIFIGENTQIQGIIFSFDKDFKLEKAPIITMAKNARINGQVYSQGYVELNDGVTINGNLTTHRFLYQTSFTRYENYIINAKLDETSLSHYYLSSALMPFISGKRKVLQWIESN